MYFYEINIFNDRDVDNPSPHEAEDEYWKIVSDKDVHMQVQYNRGQVHVLYLGVIGQHRHW